MSLTRPPSSTIFMMHVWRNLLAGECVMRAGASSHVFPVVKLCSWLGTVYWSGANYCVLFPVVQVF